MNSQINNQNDNQEVFDDTPFRNVFLDSSTKRNSSSPNNDQAKRVRLDESAQPSSNDLHLRLHHCRPVINDNVVCNDCLQKKPSPSSSSSVSSSSASSSSDIIKATDDKLPGKKFQSSSIIKKSIKHTNNAPKFIRRFRSRSLPIINYNSHANSSSTASGVSSTLSSKTSKISGSKVSTPPLPPINLQSLKEIDLHEILKNPQLRHDILFDPQLQFRPNLDGERGRKKKSMIDKYWNEIEKECNQFFVKPINFKVSRLPILFTTLRDILLSLLPYKDRSLVNEIMDIDLLIQQLNHGSFDFVSLSKWLGDIFKSHCAPMRDSWVSEMINKFNQAYKQNSVNNLVQGLRMIFSILEAMKLDVANHQIRILRPVLIETAVDFEKDYFNQLINHCKIDINDSLKWFNQNLKAKQEKKNFSNYLVNSDNYCDSNLKIFMSSSIIDLLSCRNMATEFPSTLAFDHTRLVFLRADVRQLVCIQLCIVLYKQLLINYEPAKAYKQENLKAKNITKIQEEILSIVTDDNGNVKWTRNVQSIALQLVKNITINAATNEKTCQELPQDLIEFSCNWLIKQIQPNSQVYGLMEDKIFKDLTTEFTNNLNTNYLNPDDEAKKSINELNNIANRISTLVKFHWNVFGNYYTDYVKSHQ